MVTPVDTPAVIPVEVRYRGMGEAPATVGTKKEICALVVVPENVQLGLIPSVTTDEA